MVRRNIINPNSPNLTIHSYNYYLLIIYNPYSKLGYYTFDKIKYPFIKVIYTKVSIVYVNKVRNYIHYKKLIYNSSRKGSEFLIEEEIILDDTPTADYRNVANN